ncbi:MAG TPA: hypothetical protein VFN13_02390 [Rudaea sp.]|nr:hypothetical protein [Rudaea sp.]
MAPASTSDCLTVYVAVQVVFAAGAKTDTGQVIVDSPLNGSVTVTGFNVTLPVLVTLKL